MTATAPLARAACLAATQAMLALSVAPFRGCRHKCQHPKSSTTPQAQQINLRGWIEECPQSMMSGRTVPQPSLHRNPLKFDVL